MAGNVPLGMVITFFRKFVHRELPSGAALLDRFYRIFPVENFGHSQYSFLK